MRNGFVLALALIAAAEAAATNPLVGDWAFDVEGAHWLRIAEIADGTFSAQMLWNGSPEKMTDVQVAGGLFRASRILDRNETVQYVPGVRETFAFLKTDGLHLTIADFDLQGRSLTNTLTAVARRIPPVGPAPDLSAIEFGTPVDLLKDGLEGWDECPNGNPFLWTFSDGVLENAHCQEKRRGANLRTQRDDFLDFNLVCEVRLPPKGNSGIYLRGRYEIQLADSISRALDEHAMGAYYGRVAPSVRAEKAADEWQTLDITLCERHLTVVLNGVTVIDNAPVTGVTGGAVDSDDFSAGPIVLQGDHSGVAIRKAVLRPVIKEMRGK